MPNIKIFVDETDYPALRERFAALLPDLRRLACSAFVVEAPACQLAVLPILGLPDQPRINVELHLLPKPARTRETLVAAAGRLREAIVAATGRHVAVRIVLLDAETYVALK